MIEKFNVGLLDILTILLPGGFLVGIAWQSGWVRDWPMLHQVPDGWVTGAIIASSSYVLGHFVHMVASYLDDLVFDKIKKWKWPDTTLVDLVIGFKDNEIGKINPDFFNAFKWSLAYLMQHQPLLYQAVEKHIAESKFFRSFAIVLLIAGIWAFMQERWMEGVLSFVFTILSLIRYISQRQKSLDAAYQFVISAKGKKQ